MNVCQALSSEKRFLSPRRGSNPQLSDDQGDGLTIELPRLRWRAKVPVRPVCDLNGSHDMLIIAWVDHEHTKDGNLLCFSTKKVSLCNCVYLRTCCFLHTATG